MKEYRIIYTMNPRLSAVEEEINALAKEGWSVDHISQVFNSNANTVWTTVIMVKETETK